MDDIDSQQPAKTGSESRCRQIEKLLQQLPQTEMTHKLHTVQRLQEELQQQTRVPTMSERFSCMEPLHPYIPVDAELQKMVDPRDINKKKLQQPSSKYKPKAAAAARLV